VYYISVLSNDKGFYVLTKGLGFGFVFTITHLVFFIVLGNWYMLSIHLVCVYIYIYIYNAVARLLTGTRKRESITPVLYWLTIVF